MSIDMEQFKATFIEESLEGLDIMESVLLEMQPGAADAEEVDNIFRAAHSIKGGSATFGFSDISNFTHVVETLLDQIRAGEREVTQEAIDLFLKSVDCIRDMLAGAQEGFEINLDQVAEVKAGLDRMLGSVAQAAAEAGPEAQDDATAASGWQIVFKPFPDMLRSGNDVVRLFRELDEMGEMKVEVDLEGLPALVDMEPEEACLSWTLALHGEIDREQIDEVFEWVDGDCELSIVPLGGDGAVAAEIPASETPAPEAAADGPAQAASPAPLQAAPEAGERRSRGDRRQGERRKNRASSENSSIRVGIDKVDALINLVGELVITQSMLGQLGEDFSMDKVERLKDGLAELERNTRELQENVMSIRMLPISFAFNRFPRMVHDLCGKLGKKIELKMSGEQTELDKTVMEKIGDPLVHLVRNAVDHGIETPEARLQAGKPETGTVHLNAYHQGGNILIEISDDGAGLNRERILAKAIERGLTSGGDNLSDAEVFDFLFQPGFSTAEVVSDVSGRGVGMDVVKRNITALGGAIDVESRPGNGSTFTIRLPLTLAILDGQLVRVGEQTFIIPLVSIIESLQVEPVRVNAIAGSAELYKLRDDYLPIIRLYDAFGLKPDSTNLEDGLLVVVEGHGQQAGLLVDDLLAQQQVVIKSLETNFKKVGGISGATILGDGTVALIVDIGGIIELSQNGGHKRANSAAA
ncbi:MAG TPA: chemotaxis protein CheA [Gammaproteobacteria bacterium]|nr:chemotaxis protein CheA [Gammaproteobacteria bacterium]